VYEEIPCEVIVELSGDCWARLRLRIEEIRRSLAWIEAVAERYPTWRASRPTLNRLFPDHLVIAICEGWRGEVVHCLETDAHGGLLHYKVQDPSLRNWLGLAIAVRENEISDFPICNKSFDLSYCGNDL
jgi:Ni,Fe-hydrogenase III large subunit